MDCWQLLAEILQEANDTCLAVLGCSKWEDFQANQTENIAVLPDDG
jgi:hypothetical protein